MIVQYCSSLEGHHRLCEWCECKPRNYIAQVADAEDLKPNAEESDIRHWEGVSKNFAKTGLPWSSNVTSAPTCRVPSIPHQWNVWLDPLQPCLCSPAGKPKISQNQGRNHGLWGCDGRLSWIGKPITPGHPWSDSDSGTRMSTRMGLLSISIWTQAQSSTSTALKNAFTEICVCQHEQLAVPSETNLCRSLHQ